MYILTFCILGFADQFTLHLLTYCSFVFVSLIMKGQQKLSSFFMLLKKMAVEPEKYKDGLENDGKAGEVSSVMSVVQISI